MSKAKCRQTPNVKMFRERKEGRVRERESIERVVDYHTLNAFKYGCTLYKWIMTYNVRIIRWKTLIEMRFTYPHLTILCKLILFYVRWQWLRLLWQHLHNTTHTQSTLVLLLACLPACLFHFGTHAYHNWENMGLAACWHRYCRSTIPATYVPCFIYKGFVVFLFSFFSILLIVP